MCSVAFAVILAVLRCLGHCEQSVDVNSVNIYVFQLSEEYENELCLIASLMTGQVIESSVSSLQVIEASVASVLLTATDELCPQFPLKETEADKVKETKGTNSVESPNLEIVSDTSQGVQFG